MILLRVLWNRSLHLEGQDGGTNESNATQERNKHEEKDKGCIYFETK